MGDQNVSTGGDYKTLAEFIADSKALIANTRANPVILAKMEAAGYNTIQLQERFTDLEQLEHLNNVQIQEYGEQFAATEAVQQQFATTHDLYMSHIALARIVFRHNAPVQHTLGLTGTRSRTQAGYIRQGIRFYSNAAADYAVAAALAGKGISPAALQQGKDHFSALETAMNTAVRETGEAQQATRNRDQFYETLSDWMIDYRDTAKVVLRGDGQLAEELGILVRS